MANEHDGSDEPAEGQVSETANLQQDDAHKTFQAADGVPPAEVSQQEDQSRIEAEMSPDDAQAEDDKDAEERAAGRRQV